MSNIEEKILEKIKPKEIEFISYLESDGGILMDIYNSQYPDDAVSSALKRTYKNQVARKLAEYLKDKMDDPDDLKNATKHREPNPNGYDISNLENGGDIYTLQQIKNIIPLLFLYYSGVPLITSGGGQRGGYPQWFDNVPKGMSRKKYLRLKKSKSKNKKHKRTHKRKFHVQHTKIRKKKQTRKRRVSQKGGFPCLTCLSPIFATAAGLGTSGIMMSSSSSSSNINGKKSVKRKEKYKITKNGKTHKREFKQMNKRVYDGKKMSEYDNIKEANEAYNSLIKKCKSKGFQKC